MRSIAKAVRNPINAKEAQCSLTMRFHLTFSYETKITITAEEIRSIIEIQRYMKYSLFQRFVDKMKYFLDGWNNDILK